MQLLLDVHRSLSNSPLLGGKLDFAELYQHSLPIQALGQHARCLSTQYALMHACFHRATHLNEMGDRLIWLSDIHRLWAALSQSGKLDFASLVQRLQIATLALDALRTTADWFPLRLSTEMERQLTGRQGKEPLSARLLKQKNNSRKQRFFCDMRAQQGLAQRWNFVMRSLFPTAAYMRYRYNSRAPLFCLYANRFWQGLCKLGSSSCRKG